MKLLLSLSLVASIALADEIERIESIVKDVSVLRQKYENCHEELEKIEAAPAQCEVNKLELTQRHQELLALQQKYDALSTEYDKARLEVQQRTEGFQSQITLLNKQNSANIELLKTAQKRLAELEAAAAVSQKEKKTAAADTLQEERTAMADEKRLLEQRIVGLDANRSELKHSLDEKTALALRIQGEKAQQSQQINALETELAALRQEKVSLMQELTAAKESSKALSDTFGAMEKKSSKAVAPLQCEPTETMPKLVMKPGYESLQQPRDTVWKKARTFRMNKVAPIYDAPNGHTVETWEERRSFTSLQEREGWIRITGYFVDRVWQSARDRYLWVKAEDATQR